MLNLLKSLIIITQKKKIILLNSPMVDGEKSSTLVSCLKKIKDYFKEKNITNYELKGLYVNGCNYHPSKEDHKALADYVIPV